MTENEIEVHQDAVGVSFKLRFFNQAGEVVNLSAFTLIYYVFKRPDTSVFVRTASLLTDGVDGRTVYVSVEGDLSQHGEWEIQGFAETINGRWPSTKKSFPVKPNLI